MAGTRSISASGSASDDQTVAVAYGRTVAAGSARITTSTQIGVGSTSLPISASGVIGFANQSADLTAELSGGH